MSAPLESQRRGRVALLTFAVIVLAAFIARSCGVLDGGTPAAPIGRAPVPAVSTSVSPETGPAEVEGGGAVPAALAWFAATCPRPAGEWPMTVKAMMTPQAWNLLNRAPSVVAAGWVCTNERVTLRRAGGTFVAAFTANRTITPKGGASPTTTELVTERRTLFYDESAPGWLVGGLSETPH